LEAGMHLDRFGVKLSLLTMLTPSLIFVFFGGPTSNKPNPLSYVSLQTAMDQAAYSKFGLKTKWKRWTSQN